MIPLSQRSLDPEDCVKQGGHCFATHTQRTTFEGHFLVEVCRHCPTYREGIQRPKNWVQWGEVQVR